MRSGIIGVLSLCAVASGGTTSEPGDGSGGGSGTGGQGSGGALTGTPASPDPFSRDCPL